MESETSRVRGIGIRLHVVSLCVPGEKLVHDPVRCRRLESQARAEVSVRARPQTDGARRAVLRPRAGRRLGMSSSIRDTLAAGAGRSGLFRRACAATIRDQDGEKAYFWPNATGRTPTWLVAQRSTSAPGPSSKCRYRDRAPAGRLLLRHGVGATPRPLNLRRRWRTRSPMHEFDGQPRVTANKYMADPARQSSSCAISSPGRSRRPRAARRIRRQAVRDRIRTADRGGSRS